MTPGHPLRPFGVVLLIIACLAGCGAPRVGDDPLETLRSTDVGPSTHLAAMAMLDEAPDRREYIDALERTVWLPGYTVEVRKAAVTRLAEIDPDGLKRTIRQRLPRMAAPKAVEMLCVYIADQEWTELTPALVSSWARPVLSMDDHERPEYLALVRMYGADRVPDVVFDLLLTSRRASEQGLRTRCWELLERLGRRERLATLLREAEVPADDGFLLDLQASARDLGVVPHNREEILWIRKLRQPGHRAFWDEATDALALLSAERRTALELRDVPIVVSAARHEPDLLSTPSGELYTRLEAKLGDRKHYAHGSNFEGFNPDRRNRLVAWRDELTWGDLAAMLIAVRALEVPQVVDHLFDYADRDRADTSTEYGGVLALDARGQFEVLEFPPRMRRHDQEFIASQAMLDAAYTALFHFHFHVQRVNNRDYAGPGFGDVNYADNTRANCLVMTSVKKNVINVDYYRHGRVLVDLGTIERPGAQTRGPAPTVSAPRS